MKSSIFKGKERKLSQAGRVYRSGNTTRLYRAQIALWRRLSLGRKVNPYTTVLLSHELGLTWKYGDLGSKARVH